MDHTMRNLLSEVGGMDYLVSEFVRVTQYAIPAHTFKRLVPENANQAKTKNHHPVHTQLLGSNPELMAESAFNAVQSGATHIDVNFGCPAKRVNGHGGGSVLLQTPSALYEIMSNIRKQLPEHIPLSAKIRLGYEDEALLLDNVAAIENAEIVIVGGVTYIAFVILGLNYAALLAIAVGFSVLVPYIGAAVVTIPIALVAYFQWGLGDEFTWVLVVYAIIQALDGNVLVPLLFSEVVNLHPVAIIVAVLVFGGLWGFWGVFFAIPLATLFKAVLRAWPVALSAGTEEAQ